MIQNILIDQNFELFSSANVDWIIFLSGGIFYLRNWPQIRFTFTCPTLILNLYLSYPYPLPLPVLPLSFTFTCPTLIIVCLCYFLRLPWLWYALPCLALLRWSLFPFVTFCACFHYDCHVTLIVCLCTLTPETNLLKDIKTLFKIYVGKFNRANLNNKCQWSFLRNAKLF